MQGYTFTGAASISAQMLRGDRAAFYLGELLRRYIKPNTMYQESGPVIETPLSASQSHARHALPELGRRDPVFPAVPAPWPDVTLHNFRTQGAFQLSAVRRGGVTQFVRVAQRGGCALPAAAGHRRPTHRPRPVAAASPRWRQLPDGDVDIDLRAGQEVVVHRRGAGRTSPSRRSRRPSRPRRGGCPHEGINSWYAAVVIAATVAYQNVPRGHRRIGRSGIKMTESVLGRTTCESVASGGYAAPHALPSPGPWP